MTDPNERDGPTLEEMAGDWCYLVTVRTKDGQVAHPHIQAHGEAECLQRINVLYGRATVLQIMVLHSAGPYASHTPAPRIFRRKDDPRPPERRIAQRRARPIQPNGGPAA